MKRMWRMWTTWRHPLARAAPVITAGLLAMGAGPGTAAQAGVSAAGGALTCFAIDVSGSNVVPANGEPPSDPGPVFIRQQVVELYDEILADLGYAGTQRVSVVTFGTGIGAELGVPVCHLGFRCPLAAHGRCSALRPPTAEAAWTNWVAGVNGCHQIFERSSSEGGMLAVLTDGFPEGQPVAPRGSSPRLHQRPSRCGPRASPFSPCFTVRRQASKGPLASP